jgi:hypothetical protein
MDRPAQFSRQTVRLQFPKEIHFGDDVTIWISRTGDLASHMYLRIDWPADAPTTVQPSCGTAMIDRVELLYKDQLIERIYGENMFMLGDITVPQAKQGALSNLVGKGTTSNLATYYIELPFTVVQKGLPLLALNEPPRLRVILNSSTKFTTSTYVKGINASLFVDYVYLAAPEREWFVKTPLVYLTTSWQRLDFEVPVTTRPTTFTFYTGFVRDVKELFWVVQSSASSNVYDYGTTDHLVNLRLVLNGQERITSDYATPMYLRSLQGLQYHTRIPDGRYYMYSFALAPEETAPMGEINMSMIARQQHDLTLTTHAYTRKVRIYALAYNVLGIKDGEAQLLSTIQETAPPQFSAMEPLPSPPEPPPPPTPATATGGTETIYSRSGITYKVHTFTSSGTFTVSGGSLTCSFLIVGGGGGGGLGNIELLFGAGGGGAGGLIYSASTIFQPASYAVGVGDGGDGSSSVELSGSTGGSSYIIGILEGVYGGGGGSGSLETTFPGNGGCGGGGIYYGGGNEPLQGNAGGSGDALIGAGGGGGGAGVAGANGVTYIGGTGGDGLPYSISGELQYYAGGGGGVGITYAGGPASIIGGVGGQGGGGSGDPYSMFGPNGITNTGGGGGASEYGYYPGVGGNGGSGIVIISYQL